MVAIKNIFCFITAVTAATIYQRTPATILTDITTIDTNVKALTTAVDNYNGGFFNLLTVSSTESTLETSIKNAAKDAANTSQLSSADSNSVLDEINHLIPDIQEALNALVAKKSTFANAGVASTVESDLANLKQETDAFGKNLLAISSSDVEPKLSAALSTIDNDFTNAQTAFSGGS
ncbi:putative hydrophobic surface binding protein a protein [Botrytis fragariae]|uniref:Putative hydrophobic surface binding protein a protein n=1 Tax=Botrytis fragariae TaxID=1964551 RepID=A0A8H6EMN0_9HELO|nr:putative hydrophobic surface binding protein a protein [Botrytis fragariae]KAF5877709.1 putative hydrophobic surface binding protein a protein [Botrytis fragariae]